MLRKNSRKTLATEKNESTKINDPKRKYTSGITTAAGKAMKKLF